MERWLSDLAITETIMGEIGSGAAGDALRSELLALSTANASDFEWIKILKFGCNAFVALARCTKPGHPSPAKVYAVKVIFNLHMLDSKRMKQQHRREFEIMRDLWSCTSVVRLWAAFFDTVPASLVALVPVESEGTALGAAGGAGGAQSTWFAVMDAHERDLEAFRSLGPPVLPFQEFITLAKSMIHCLKALDDRKIVHRDLKLNNILLKRDGSLCICDFGEATHSNGPERRVILLTGEEVGGNVVHLAPEVRLAGLAVTSGKTGHFEISFKGQASFEAGVLLCELACGVHPVAGYNTGRHDMTYSDAELCCLPEERKCGLRDAGYPVEPFLTLIRRLVAFRPEDRLPLTAVLTELDRLTTLDVDADWTCDVCTLVNHSLSPACGVCDSPKRVSAAVKAAVADVVAPVVAPPIPFFPSPVAREGSSFASAAPPTLPPYIPWSCTECDHYNAIDTSLTRAGLCGGCACSRDSVTSAPEKWRCTFCGNDSSDDTKCTTCKRSRYYSSS